ncbi:glycosyl hydrolase family 28-related protein [Pelagicoccus sp. SDUM812003]|uniref:glycosyl hydrolase family 28-related protein n=1 Tax=Pelagicoccus sp. SDUM812003 TaxID=3041267 RepID=UPI00280F97CF|nr:glycosyl hydrolase family 28-related protein [Pelagicoccus sp. SDUM812003]MDQ8202275.1 glycosyl hydrolase family 28-related protein [Pelagicoccus sp. SDUM812003]
MPFLPYRVLPLLVAGILAHSLPAQNAWRSSLYPEDWVAPHQADNPPSFIHDLFLQDFSYAGYRQGEQPIPQPEWKVFDAVEAFAADPTGETDSTAAIQMAIDAASQKGGGIVFLQQGSYRLSLPPNADACLSIHASNVILRGAGTERTFLFNTTTAMRNAEIIRVRPPDWGSWTSETSQEVLLAADALGPTRTIALEQTEGFSVGDWIVVHNPATNAFVKELNMAIGADGVSWLDQADSLGGPRILRRIVAIDTDNKAITLDIPTRWALNTRDGARVYRTASHLSEVGLEQFSIGNHRVPGSEWGETDYTDPSKPAYHAHDSFAIEMRGVVNGWIQDIRSFNPKNDNGAHLLSNGVKLEWSRNITLQRLHLSHAQYGGGGGNGYMIRLNSANECLVADSEVGHCRHGIVMWRMENSGNVITRCYDHNSGIQIADTSPQPTAGIGSDHHGVFSHSNLFDSNRVERAYLEAAYRGDWGGNPDHGMTSSQTLFWNTRGDAYHEKADYIVHSQQFGHGYIIGTSGNASAIRLTEKRPGSAERTAPVDFSEGIDRGESLIPQSIYQDQLQRRTGVEAPASN